MTTISWVRIDRWMRGQHLYTSLFLVPWMMVHAISGFFVNHNEWFSLQIPFDVHGDMKDTEDFDAFFILHEVSDPIVTVESLPDLAVGNWFVALPQTRMCS